MVPGRAGRKLIVVLSLSHAPVKQSLNSGREIMSKEKDFSVRVMEENPKGEVIMAIFDTQGEITSVEGNAVKARVSILQNGALFKEERHDLD